MQLLDLESLFSSEKGKAVYDNAVRAISDFDMKKDIFSGVLVGLSGGADSVMLLCFLAEYRKRNGDFKIQAVHVNHGIRGDEADSDEDFSRRLSELLDIDFCSCRFDVPSLAKACGKGLEETARDVRYSCFNEIISGRDDLGFVAVAHNSTDNLETVLLNIMRGAGSRGASGIPPKRDNIIRPLLYSSKELIISALNEASIEFVIDSTNLSSEYKRNFVRNEILPRLKNVCENPEEMFKRFSSNLRSDDSCLNDLACKFLLDNKVVKNGDLLSLPKAILRRVIVQMAGITLSERLMSDIIDRLNSVNFRYDIGDGLVFVSERGVCRVVRDNECIDDFSSELLFGKNAFMEKNAEIILSSDKLPNSFLNVYKISIQHDLSGVIINGRLRIRRKEDGDTIYYGGMTRKLKKLFSDRKIPLSKRELIPVIYDDSGVVCVPGFGVRDDGAKPKDERLYLTVGIIRDAEDDRFYIGSEFRT